MAGFTDTARTPSIRRHKRSRYLQAIEALENRVLMDADLQATWVTWGPSPDVIIEGDAINATATIRIVTGSFPSTAVPAGKTIDVKIFARPADALDNTHDILINKGLAKVSISN